MSEADLKRAVIAALRLVPHCHPMRRNAGKMFIKGRAGDKRVVDVGEAGTPDIEVMLPRGHTLWIELKTETGKVTDKQKIWHAIARQLDHEVVVVRDPQTAVNLVRERVCNILAAHPTDTHAEGASNVRMPTLPAAPLVLTGRRSSLRVRR